MSKNAQAFMIRGSQVTYGLFAVDGVVVETAPAGRNHLSRPLAEALNLLIQSGHIVMEVKDNTYKPVTRKMIQELLKAMKSK